MLEFRLKSLEIYNRMGIPNWIPDISGLDMANIHTYVKPKVDMEKKTGTKFQKKLKALLTV